MTAKLAGTGLGDAQDLADFAKGHTLQVVQGDGDAFFFGKALHGVGNFCFEFFLFVRELLPSQ